jgi:DNA-binding IclR family transcriptional regulator
MSKIVERTLDCFELFADQKRPLSLSEVSRLLKIPPSSCHDVLQALEGRGYIYEIAPRGGYYPTLRILNIAETIAKHDPVLARAEILMQSLRTVLDETVLLAKVDGLQATYLLALESSHPLRISISVGDHLRSIAATSAGKALLASLDDHELDEYLKKLKLAALTPFSVKTKAELRAQIEAGRKKGWYLNNSESLEGVTTLSAMFRWNDAQYIVTIAGPSARLDPKLEWASASLMDVCKRMEMRPGK